MKIYRQKYSNLKTLLKYMFLKVHQTYVWNIIRRAQMSET